MWLQLGSDMVTPFLFLSSQLFGSVGYIYPHWLLFFAILLALQSLKLFISAALLFSSGFSLFFAMLPCLQSPKLYISATHLCPSYLFVRFPTISQSHDHTAQPSYSAPQVHVLHCGSPFKCWLKPNLSGVVSLRQCRIWTMDIMLFEAMLFTCCN